MPTIVLNVINIDPRPFEPLPSVDSIPRHSKEHRAAVDQAGPIHLQHSRTAIRREAKCWNDQKPPAACNDVGRSRKLAQVPRASSESCRASKELEEQWSREGGILCDGTCVNVSY